MCSKKIVSTLLISLVFTVLSFAQPQSLETFFDFDDHPEQLQVRQHTTADSEYSGDLRQ